MAKPAPSPSPATPAVQIKTLLDHPEQLGPRLAAALTEGWQLLAIVACRHSNEHAAYLRRH